ncbi:unnamed protein product [Orchesella dallaii]|uniref:Uncharacterized protein n=1 Tax=Orchesella dallaii TaxID=48710 RepID=A0ABP1RPY5_9HEXA
MTAETEPSNFPKSIKDVVTRSDFDLISSTDFYMTILFTENVLSEPSNHPEVFSGLLDVFRKIFFVRGNIQSGLENAVKGQLIFVLNFEPKNVLQTKFSNISTVRDFLRSHWYGLRGQKQFSKIAALCKNDCKKYWTVALLHMQNMHVVIPVQAPFYSTTEFWVQASAFDFS